jgi:hypothetical protein
MQAYKIALEAISPEHYDRKQIWQALPTKQAILGSRLVRDGKWQEGLQLLLNSLRSIQNKKNLRRSMTCTFISIYKWMIHDHRKP